MSLKFPSLSLCMIVKDEEAWVAKAIQSVQAIVSQIVVLDTGSTDRTVEICQALRAEVYHAKWQGNFAAARNLSLSKATGDWILVLDADEQIAKDDLVTLQELTLVADTCFDFYQRHYTSNFRLSGFKQCSGEFLELEAGQPGYFESNLVRLFPNNRGIRYRGEVHELVEPAIRETKGLKIAHSDIRIHHYGHTEQITKHKTKSEAYQTLAESKVSENSKHWKNHFDLGVEYNLCGKYKESADSFKRAAALNPRNTQTWVNLGHVLIQLGQYADAEKAILFGLNQDSKSEELLCNLGALYLRINNHEAAAEALLKAVVINPKYANAWSNLGIAYANSHKFEQAIEAYRKAIGVAGATAEIKAELGAVLYYAKQYQEAEKLLGEALAEDPSLKAAELHINCIKEKTGRATQHLPAERD